MSIPTPKPDYFFSDICGTLYRGNTSYLFLQYYFGKSNSKKAAYFKILVSIPAKVVWKVVGSFMEMEWLRIHLLGLLKGEEEAKIKYEARNFVKDELPKYKIKNTWEIYSKHSSIVLVSGTLSTLAQILSEQLGAEYYFATQMEVHDGKYTGKIKSDVRNNKLEILLRSNYAKYLSSSTFMTDNMDDLPLINTVHKAIVITKSITNQQFWLNQNVPGITFVKV